MQMWIKQHGFEVSWLRTFYSLNQMQKFDKILKKKKIKGGITDINNYF